MRTLYRLLQPEMIVLFSVGLGMIGTAKLIRMMRLPSAQPSTWEPLVRWLGVLIILCSVVVSILFMKPESEQEQQEQPSELKDYSDTAPGCSRPSKGLRELKK